MAWAQHGRDDTDPGTGRVPEGTAIIRVLFSIHDCSAFIHLLFE
jgi:hypothetical protein